jgi:hypothetical protein
LDIDFDELGAGEAADTVLEPREIFSALPAKDARYQYPRDVQSEVWTGWFPRRNEPEVVLKMNTGGGKTVVGLLVLKSCLNEGKGPAVYVCPDPLLVDQVIQEANALGLEVTDDEDDFRFRRGQAILVINIYKLINGKSRFGVGSEGTKIRIGSVVIDDVHACLSTTLNQFTLTIAAPADAYTKLLALFKEELHRQSEPTALDIEQGYTSAMMQVPFWAWQGSLNKVTAILNEAKDTDEVKFIWPLIKEHLTLCTCVFAGGKVEISPRCVPIGVIPSFVGASRRIFMTATLADDSILVTHFNANPEAVRKPISPTTASDVGDRMILVPQELNGTAEDDEVKALAKKVSAAHNVVVIVPSHKRAGYWADVAVMTLSSSANNLADGIAKLRAGHVGLVVLVNRYDGIDLPHAACRVLIVDGLPDVRRKIECIDQSLMDGSEQLKSQSIQRIEQGMGRGIRSSEDYCVVILMGRSLISMLYADNSLRLFTAATRAQLELSQKLANQLRGKPVTELEGVMNSCLTRDRKWVAASKGVLVKLRPTAEGSVRPLAEKMRKAFDAVEIRDYPQAERLIQEAINATTDRREKGWLKYLLAEYTNYTNPVEAQKLVKSALGENRALLKPIDGIAYTCLMTPDMNQAKQCSEYHVDKYGDGNKIVIAMNGILEELDFITDNSSRFEEALKQLGFFIGFRGQRPESEVGKGPDNVWEVGSLKYFVIEAKNGATTNTISKDYCNQLGGSMNWFASQYDSTCSATPIMIHPSHVFEHASSPHANTRIIDSTTLPLLREACRKFAQSVANKDAYRTPASVADLLKAHGLTAELFVARFTVKFRVK